MVWRTAGWALFLAAIGIAQENGPAGLLRGDLLAWSGSPRAGQFVFHTADNRTYSCSYDVKTYFERESRRITMAEAVKGDRVEVVSDHRLESNVCYAMTVHVLDTPGLYTVPGLRPRPKPAVMPKSFLPHPGDLTLSGVVIRITSDALILRARSGERQILKLRADTRFYDQGQTGDSGSLRANTVVFVQGRRNLDDEVEAYQVVWGGILQPEQ